MNQKNTEKNVRLVGAGLVPAHIKGKTQKGITLIALVITIIVLLILAGVTISMVLGDDGIIQNAQAAKEANEQAQLKEENAIDSADRYINLWNPKTETLQIVPTQSSPDPNTFVYTEKSGYTHYAGYVTAKESTMQGGLLKVNFDENKCQDFEVKIYLFDENGNPYLYTGEWTFSYKGNLSVPTYYRVPGNASGFTKVKGPFTVPIPEGCTVMLNMRARTDVFVSTDGSITSSADFAKWACEGGITISLTSPYEFSASAANPNVKSISHRGTVGIAPENTLSAYKFAKKVGFDMVECDVCFTSDNVPVLLHDNTINRTARNSDGTEITEDVAIANITYEQALNYDFGIWKSSNYAGEKIPSFEEFISLCKDLNLHPYIELKTELTETNANLLVSIVDKYGMINDVSWISANKIPLEKIKNLDNTARLGIVTNVVNDLIITNALSLKTNENEVFIDAIYSCITEDIVTLCKNNNLPLEVWNITGEPQIEKMKAYNYISGMTCDTLPAGVILNRYN